MKSDDRDDFTSDVFDGLFTLGFALTMLGIGAVLGFIVGRAI